MEDVEEVEESAELEAAAEGSSGEEEEPHAAVREVGEQQRVGQRAVAQADAPERLALFVAVAVSLVERRAHQAVYESHRRAFRRCRRHALVTLQVRAHVRVRVGHWCSHW